MQVPSPNRERTSDGPELVKESLLAGEPLQIVRLDMEANEVQVNDLNLQKIEERLCVSGADNVSIVSIMGTYRTGKSFLMDLMMRYLRSWREYDAKSAEQRFKSWHFGEEDRPKNSPKAPWFYHGNQEGRITEGLKRNDVVEDRNSLGFVWQCGMDKCTEGIWLWSQPFIFKHNGERTAVLLMDTQGAWDSKMTKEQSATIFGLTALLSSKLVYNIQNRISEDKVDNLDYFTTFAKIAARELPGSGGFGDLHFLVRDWEHYEDGWDVGQCCEQVDRHLGQHLDPEMKDATRSECVTRIQEVFRNVACTALPHPGKKVPRKDFAGDIQDIDFDFCQLLDGFMNVLFRNDSEFPRPSAPLGHKMEPGAFARVVVQFVQAFHAAQPSAQSLRQAFVTCETHKIKEDLIADCKSQMEKLMPHDKVVDPDMLDEEILKIKKELDTRFHELVAPLSLPNEEAESQSLADQINGVLTRVSQDNQRELNSATMKLVATPVLVLPAFLTIVSLPHLILYPIIAGGGLLHLKVRSNSPNEMCTQDAFEGVRKDLVKFAHQRAKDIQAMVVAAQRFNPNSTLNLLITNARNVQGPLQAALQGGAGGKDKKE